MRVIFGRQESLFSAFLCLIILGASPFEAWASDSRAGSGLATSVRVQVVDEVKDGCWTNALQIKALAERLFRESGLKVVDSPLDFFSDYPDFRKITIRASGYRTTSGVCIGSLTIHSNLEVSWSSQGANASSAPEPIAEAQIGTYLLSASKNLNDLFARSVQKTLTECMASLSRAPASTRVRSASGSRFLDRA